MTSLGSKFVGGEILWWRVDWIPDWKMFVSCRGLKVISPHG